ncbi:hypothetical protein BDZ45DRAFT_633423 [Acephala macrosclerotiorum]|nr:hypothetical protein BDZ45DRAFT_633423 [Acephala macrosclerotiorum]
MLSSLLRPKKHRQHVEEGSVFSTPYEQRRHATADFTEDDGEDEESDEDDEEEGEEDVDEEDGGEDSPLLPIFSAAHLDALPVYNLTHAIRLIVLPRTETTLTWDQLRSPQVSQFLVKPMQQQIRTSHFSRATLYALMANCLQFQKESQANPGNAGNSRTRALVCELLAIKLLKEYNTRELIDALSYDFYPLQGLSAPASPVNGQSRPRPVAARISTLEVAIRASAKRFIAHPLVVQQLEAIWAGTIVFHSAADNLHRRPPEPQMQEYRRHNQSAPLLTVPEHGYGTANRGHSSPDKQPPSPSPQYTTLVRRTVTLYDPRDASLFKLSRLRVPRYRQFFSTCSLAILLVLFIAVLAQRSTEITTLEVVFWFWSFGFMLDEVVGFNEQGFSLYIMSFWNAFDLGILLLLTIYYCMRLYGLFLVNEGRRGWNSMAYDVLATNAILLFPRLFSVLDHYRYFSQLLIAFRLMAIDLVAVFVLVLIACSGFFVAFTLSFGEGQYDAAEVAYKIFQILMGFTPAAWEAWETYNGLGRALLVLFLFICHFLIVTILITVLTNSFMAIVSNADQEHQFVFAVNTISMVKNDALFSYVAPSNIFAWVLTPLRFCMPFRLFVKTNRTIIKASHFPLLFGIYIYERIFLARTVFDPTDLIENNPKGRRRIISFQDTKTALFSPNARLRQESIAGFQKDKALEEVFRLAPRPETLRSTRRSIERRQTHNVVSNWMDHNSGVASPPQEQDRSIVDKLEMRRQARKATMMRHRGISGTRSVASDPAEFMSHGGLDFGDREDEPATPDVGDHSDEDGDDELNTHDDDEGFTLDKDTTRNRSRETSADDKGSYFATPTPAQVHVPSSTSSRKQRFVTTFAPPTSPPRRRGHDRNMSSNTILFNPISDRQSSASPPRSRPLTAKHHSTANTRTHTPTGLGTRTPRHSIYTQTQVKPRPIMPARQNVQSVPNFNLDSQLATGSRSRHVRHRRSSMDMGMSEIGLDNNAPGMQLGAVPSSFATQLAMATGGLKAFGGRAEEKGEDTDGMMGRLMLARMKTLEEGFAEVVKEFRGMRTAGNSSVENDENQSPNKPLKGKGKEKVKREKKKSGLGMVRTTSEVDFAKMDREIEKKGQREELRMGDDVLTDRDTPEGDIIRRYISKGSSL